MGTTLQERVRWILSVPGAPTFRGPEGIVVGPIRQLRPRLESDSSVDSFYVSKHNGRDVWLTVFATLPEASDLISAIEAQLAGLACQTDHASTVEQEELLTDACAAFRKCIGTMTRVGLDLHDPAQLVENQQGLIRIGCTERTARNMLEPLLSSRSPTYASLPDQDAFWTGFSLNCLAGQHTDCGHWLYNLVLGCDWFEGQPEAAIAAHIGIPVP